jgi:hypothetical protein
MNSKVVIAVVVVLLLAGGAYIYSRRPSPNLTPAPTDQSAVSKVSEAAQFATAMATGTPTVCVLSKDNNTMTYHLKGKMMRTDYTMTSPDATASSPSPLLSHMINDTQFIYTWTDGQKQGAKFAVTTPASPSDTATQPVTEPNKPATPTLGSEEDYNSLKDSGYTINCQSGNVSDADFVPPTDVNFVDTAAMMRNIPSPGANGQIDYKKLQQQYGTMPGENN